MTEAQNIEEKAPDPLDPAYDAWSRGEYGEAVDELNRFLARRPYSTEAFEMKIDVLRHANLNLYFAEIIQDRYLQRSGRYAGLTPGNRHLGRWRRIDAEFDRVAYDRRQRPDISYRAAILCISVQATAADTGRIDIDGVADMTRALGTPTAALLDGMVNARTGRYERATDVLERAATGSPPAHEAFALLSRVHAARGRHRRAAALAHLSMMSGNHLWYTTGAVNFDTLEIVMRSYGEFNPLQTEAEGLRYSGLPRYVTSLEDLPRTPVRLPLRFKTVIKRVVSIRVLILLEGVLDKTPLGGMLRRRRYS